MNYLYSQSCCACSLKTREKEQTKYATLIGIRIADMGHVSDSFDNSHHVRRFNTFKKAAISLCVWQWSEKKHAVHFITSNIGMCVDTSIHLFEKFPLTNKLSACRSVEVPAGAKKESRIMKERHTSTSTTSHSFFFRFVCFLSCSYPFFVLLCCDASVYISFFHWLHFYAVRYVDCSKG